MYGAESWAAVGPGDVHSDRAEMGGDLVDRSSDCACSKLGQQLQNRKQQWNHRVAGDPWFRSGCPVWAGSRRTSDISVAL